MSQINAKSYENDHSKCISHKAPKDENYLKILSEISLPLLIAGFGMVAAGILLDQIKTSVVFVEMSEIYILLPALLGLKGNIEMTMTSRLSSLANCGQLNEQNQMKIFQSNIALVQCQSIVIGFAAAIFAIVVSIIQSLFAGNLTVIIDMKRIVMLCATSIITASLTSLLLATIMIIVICMTIKHNINPDNVATPIAAALGDLVTLLILYCFSSIFYSLIDDYCSLMIAIILISLSSVKWLANYHYDINVKHLRLSSSLNINTWIPMLSAMLISSSSGFILSYCVLRFKNITLYQPLVNGFAGNLASIQASKLSSYLHMLRANDLNEQLTDLIEQMKNKNKQIFTYFIGTDEHCKCCQTLLSVVIPFHTMFFILINHLHQYSDVNNVSLLLASFLISTLIQVYILLYLTNFIIIILWTKGHNPDDCCIPYLTSIGDLFGTILLTIAFYIYELFE